MTTETSLRAGMSTQPEPVRLPELGPRGWARWAWRQLTSMRTALVLLFLLALAAVPGSILPQRPSNPDRVTAYARAHSTLFPLYDRLSLFDVFSSPWFSAIYLLLFVSLVGCVVPRSRLHWRAARARPPAAPRTFERLPQHRTITVDAPVEDVLAAAATTLRRRRYRIERGAVTGGTGAVAAERGHLRETGNLVFHLSLILVLVGVALGHLFGFKGNVIVVEGASFANVDGAYDTLQTGPRQRASSLAPFTLTLDDFSVHYVPTGAQAGTPQDFAAKVTYRPDPGAAPRTAVVAPNRPLVVDHTKVFLTGNGYALRWTVRDGAGQVAFKGAVPFLPQNNNLASDGVIKLADAAPRPLALAGLLLPTAALVDGVPTSVFPGLKAPRVLITAFTGDWGADDGSPQSVYSLDPTAKGLTQVMDPKDPKVPYTVSLGVGDSQTLPGGNGTVTLDGIDRFVNFKIAHDPGTRPALVGTVLALAGLMASLFVRRRRVWVRATAAGPGRTVVEVGGLSRTEEEGLAAHVDALTADLTGALGAARPSSPLPQQSGPQTNQEDA